MNEQLMKGKIPPQAIDMEKAVLGAALIDEKGLDVLFEIVKDKEAFYDTKHRLIYSAIYNLFATNKPVDLLTVTEELTSMGKLEAAGSMYYVIELTEGVSSSAHIDFHARIIMQKYISRKIIQFCNRGLELAYDDKVDVFTLLDNVGAAFDKISETIAAGHSSLSWHDAVLQIPKRVEFLTNNQGNITGLPTGLESTDKHFSGWQNEDFIVIGADSGMGKTAFVMNNMIAAAKAGKSVGMFSMEMSVTQLAIRGVAVESNYHMNQLSRHGFEKQHYFEGLINVVEKVKDYPIFIDDQPALTVVEMKRKARSMKRNNKIELLVIDFMQMFSGDKDIRINISDAARACKNLAKELKIPVIALSQLSREVRKVKYCIPSKHHLKESSAIEEAADVIALLYRPEYYGYSRETHPDLYNELGLDFDNNAALLVAKNRNGALGNVGMYYVENKTKYVNPSEAYQYQNNNPVASEDNTTPF